MKPRTFKFLKQFFCILIRCRRTNATYASTSAAHCTAVRKIMFPPPQYSQLTQRTVQFYPYTFCANGAPVPYQRQNSLRYEVKGSLYFHNITVKNHLRNVQKGNFFYKKRITTFVCSHLGFSSGRISTYLVITWEAERIFISYANLEEQATYFPLPDN